MFSEMMCAKNNKHVNYISIFFCTLFNHLINKSLASPIKKRTRKKGTCRTYSVQREGKRRREEWRVIGVTGDGTQQKSKYEQGIRTPSADQIQDITATLSAYSHIEGKNVFYWFQNHKARQRQRHKQQSLAYFNLNNRFLYTSHPIFSSSLCSNESERMHKNGQHSKVALRRPMSTNCDWPQVEVGEHTTQQRMAQELRTLTLFPLHPTGILEGKTRASLSSSATTFHVNEQHGGPANQLPFFDFFPSPQGSHTR